MPCKRFLLEKVCDQQSEKCYWDPHPGTCVEHGNKVPCTDRDEIGWCEKYGCIWNDVVRFCHEEGDSIPCDRVYDSTMCKARADCRFDEPSDMPGRCVLLDHKDPCTFHIKQPPCEADSECIFHPTPTSQGIMKYVVGKCYPRGDGLCMHLDKEKDCVAEDTFGLCAWDFRLFQCRQLATPLALPAKDEL